MPESLVNYSKVCRLCLQPGDDIVSIFSTENGDEHLGPQSLALKIQACVSIEIRSGDRISTLICNKCKENVSSWCKFKNTCDESQTKLRDWLTTNVPQDCLPNYNAFIKEEPIDHEEVERPGSPDASIFEPNVSIKVEVNANPIQISSITGRYSGAEPPILVSETTIEDDDSQPPVLEPQRHLLSSLGLAPTGAILHRDYERNQHNVQADTEDLYPMDTADSMDSADESSRNQIPKRRKRNKNSSPNCRVCGLKFANIGNAKRHEKNVHKYFDDIQPNPMSPLIAKKSKSRIQNMEIEINDSLSQASQDETMSQDDLSQDGIMSQEEETDNVDIVTLEAGTGMLTQDQLDFIGRNTEILDAVRAKICCCCNKQYPALKPLLSHMRKRYVVPSFQCYYCLISFENRSLYCKHVGKHRCRDMYSVYKSLLANGTPITIVPTKSSLKKIIKPAKSEPVDTTPVRVQYNNISTNSGKSSKLPLKDALASKIFGCNFCDFRSRLKVDVKKHVVRSHPVDLTQDLLRCRYCAQDFENIELRKRHNNNADCTSHVICELCNVKFDNLPAFNDHASGSHASFTKSSDRSYTAQYNAPTACHLCPKSYATPHNLIRHMKTSHGAGSTTYNCRFCNEGFRLKMLARAHEKECPDAEQDQKLSLPQLPNQVNNGTNNDDDCNFSCKVCGALFKTIELWTQHQDLHRRCTLCSEAFLTQNELDLHMKKHLKLKLYNCNLCSNTYSSAIRLQEHIVTHKENEPDTSLPQWLCEICDLPFTNPIGYAKHMKAHNEMPTLHPVNDLDIDGLNEPDFKDDMKRPNSQQHDTGNDTTVEEEIFECHLCQKRVGSKQGLYRHVLYAHKVNLYKSPVKDDRGYKCNLCDNYYATKHGMNRHKRNVHGRGESMSRDTVLNPIAIVSSKKCDKCDYIARSAEELAEHKLYVHNTNGAKLCSVCNVVVANSKALWYHKKKFHPELMRNKTVDCEICGENFQSKVHLYKHIKSVHVPAETDVETQESQDEVTFPCTICSQIFYSSSSLYRHKKTHLQENVNPNTKSADAETLMHPCDVCQKSFRTALGLDRHKVTHEPPADEEGEEDLQCDLCPKMFTSTGALKSHRGWHLRAANGRTQDLENTDNGTWKPNSISPSRLAKRMRYSSLLPGEDSLVDDDGGTENFLPHSDEVVIIPIIEKQKPTENKIIKAALEKAENTHCKLCNVTFKHVTLYRRHLMEVHRSVRTIPTGTLPADVVDAVKKMGCFTCNLTFKEKAEWIDHKVHHINEYVKSNKLQQWPCDCGKTFKRKDHLKSHFRTHMHIVSDSIAESAPTPTAPTATAATTSAPAATTAPTFYTCNLCRLSFKSSKDLRAHVNSHTKEQIMMRQNFKCDFCGIITTDFKQYQECRKMHHVPTKYKCNACKIYFKNHETLVRHHHDQHTDLPLEDCIKTTYDCTQCDKQYTLKHYLKKHMETVH